jgi:hypothetical protein
MLRRSEEVEFLEVRFAFYPQTGAQGHLSGKNG